MFKAVIKNTPLFLALLTASLFAFGFTFHQGYLEYWRLEESMFQLSFERTLFQGALARLVLILGLVLALLVAVVIVLIRIFIFYQPIRIWVKLASDRI